MAFPVVVGLRFVIVHFESILWMSFIVDNLVLAIGVHERVPTFYVSITIRHFMPLLGILVVICGESKLVALRPMDSLFEFTRQSFD